MKVKITRVCKGTFLSRAKEVLIKVSYLNKDQCDRAVDGISKNGEHKILHIRTPISPRDWNEFTSLFESYQVPSGYSGSASNFIESDDSEEEDSTTMQLFCIKTEARTGNKYEILVLATTKEIALEYAIRDPAVVKEITVWPGPFTNGTVLSTRLITK